MRKSRPVPKYRKHKPTGQAVVTLNGRDHYLGPHYSKTSIAEYDRLIAEWLANGRRLPQDDDDASFTINEMIVTYWNFATGYYVKNGKPTDTIYGIKAALRFVQELYGRTQARDFSPRALKACRQKMIEAGWVRSTINQHVGRIRRMFKWGAENELVPGRVFRDLQTVSGLQEGRTEANESEPVLPVADAEVEAIELFVSRQVLAMICLQQLTGMRPDEVTIMRACDLDTTESVWVYTPESHKTEHHGKGRYVYIGPRGQNVLRPFLAESIGEPMAYLFSPADAETERKAEQRKNRKSPVQPSQRDRRRPGSKRKPQARYTTDSYRRAIVRACERAFEMPAELRDIHKALRSVPAEQQAAEKERLQKAASEWRAAPCWSPNQLRHSAGTEIRRQAGLEAAQVVLGHSKADVTQVYAERDREKAIAYMQKHG